jgi:hypothetical protein
MEDLVGHRLGRGQRGHDLQRVLTPLTTVLVQQARVRVTPGRMSGHGLVSRRVCSFGPQVWRRVASALDPMPSTRMATARTKPVRARTVVIVFIGLTLLS